MELPSFPGLPMASAVVELDLRTAGLGGSMIRKSSAVVTPIEDVSEPVFLDLDPSSTDEDRVRGSRTGWVLNID